MSTSTIYRKTFKFVLARMALTAIVIVASIFLGLIFYAFIRNAGSGAFWVMLIIWLLITGLLNNVVNHWFGYLVKAGHLAVIVESVKTGQVPDTQVKVAAADVKKRFVSANVYFVVDRLINRSVNQLQRVLGGLENILDAVPGINTIMNFAKVFISIALNYIDECCLSWSFYQMNDTAPKCAADGIVLYFQNWKVLLKKALFLAIGVCVSTVVVFLVFSLVFVGIFSAAGWYSPIGYVVALLFTYFVKAAFIDSWVMISMVKNYVLVASQSEVQYNLYDKLCGMSKSFRELFNKGHNEPVSDAVSQTI